MQRALTGSLLASLFFTATASAEPGQVDLDAAVGYVFGGTAEVEADYKEGRINIDDGPALTGIVSYQLQSNGSVFLNYTRHVSGLEYVSDDLDTREETSMNADIIQFGGNLSTTRGAMSPYFGISLGATHFGMPDLDYGFWSFSAALDAGVKIDLTKRLHLRALGRVPFTFAQSESESFCVSYAGCVVLVSGGPIVQAEIFGGLGLSF